jgi:hypothetical protein
MELADTINKQYQDEGQYPGWQAIIFQTNGLQRSELVAHYLAMDVGVVTPKKDGMNLVGATFTKCHGIFPLFLCLSSGGQRDAALQLVRWACPVDGCRLRNSVHNGRPPFGPGPELSSGEEHTHLPLEASFAPGTHF